MSISSRSGSEQPWTIQSLVKEALILLKLVEEKIPMEDPQIKPIATEATESVEELLSALEDSEELAVAIYESEIEQLREEVKNIDWSQYQKREFNS